MTELKKTLDKMHDAGLLIKREYKHLTLYKYSTHTVINNLWNVMSLKCRGLVLNDEGEIVANCIPKFFNYEEIVVDGKANINFNQNFTVYEKYDGSLIQVFMDSGELFVSSSGSFDNDYTKLAQKILEEKYPKQLEFIKETNRVNFIFELIAPLTEIIVDYEGETDMILLAVRESTGNEPNIVYLRAIGFNCAKRYEFDDINDIVRLKHLPFDNREGFVIQFEDKTRMKFKFEEYVKLHYLKNYLSKKLIWEKLSNEEGIDFDSLPDEAYKKVESWRNELWKEYNDKMRYIRDIYYKEIPKFLTNAALAADRDDKKKFATYILENHKDVATALFRLFDGKSIDDLLWKMIKPKGDENGN